MITVKNLVHFYGNFQALKGIDFTVPKGSVSGFIGPNGAGKSTVLKILSGYLSPTSGDILIEGLDYRREPMSVRQRIGYMQETPHLYKEMRVAEYLDYVAILKGVSFDGHEKMREQILERCGLLKLRNKLIGGVSKGNRQRVALAQALVGNPGVLLLDEPTSALDPGHVIDTRNFIRSFRGEKTILMSSHILSEISQICDYIIMIRDGRVHYQGTVYGIANLDCEKHEVTIKIADPGRNWDSVLSVLPGSQCLEMRKTEYKFLLTQQDIFYASLFQVVSENQIPLREIYSSANQLESFFQGDQK